MFEFTKLRDLHSQMKIEKETKTIFTITYNNKTLSCIFIVDENPYALFLTSLGANPLVWEFKVKLGYKVDEHIDDYYELLNYLEIRIDPSNKFTPYKFFSYINDRIPKKVVVPQYLVALKTISKKRKVEESEKIFFCGWKSNPKAQSVTPKNYQKTKIAFGFETAELSVRKNMSSCWTDIENKEKLAELCKLK